jgi:hypothetical protein
MGFVRRLPRSTSKGVRQLSKGLARLSKKGIDAVLLELSLPDSHGIETFDKLFIAAPVRSIILTGERFSISS